MQARALAFVLTLMSFVPLSVADDGGKAVVYLTVQGPPDKLPDAQVQAFEDELRAVASASLRPLGYRLFDRQTLTALFGAGITARTGCDEACRFGPIRNAASTYGVQAIVDAEVTSAAAYSVRIRLLEARTLAALTTTTLEGPTLAALQARLAPELGKDLASSALPKRTLATDVAQALKVGDMAPNLTLKPDDGPSLALGKPTKQRGPIVLLVVDRTCTGGCAEILNELTAEWPSLRALKAQIVIVSAADPDGRRQFASKDGPPRMVVADSDGAIAGALGLARGTSDAVPAVIVLDRAARVRGTARPTNGLVTAYQTVDLVRRIEGTLPDTKVAKAPAAWMTKLRAFVGELGMDLLRADAARLRKLILTNGPVGKFEAELVAELAEGRVVTVSATDDFGRGATTVVLARPVPEARFILTTTVAVDPTLQKATTKEWLTRLAKGGADAAAVRDLLRSRVGDATRTTTASGSREWAALREFILAQDSELGKLPEPDAQRGRRTWGRVLAELDGRCGDVVPNEIYDWLLK